MPIITDPTKWKERYTDIDLNFLPNPVTKDISIKKNENAILQSMKVLVNTMFYEKPFHPEIGSNLYKLLFEPANVVTKIMLRDGIINTLTNWEPRIDVKDVEVTFSEDEHEVHVDITYIIKNTTIPLTAQFILYRSR